MPKSFSQLNQEYITYVMFAPYPNTLSEKATSVFYLDINVLRTIVQHVCSNNDDYYHVIKTEKWSIEDFDFPEYIVDPLKRLFMFLAYIDALKRPSRYKRLLQPRDNFVVKTGSSNILWIRSLHI